MKQDAGVVVPGSKRVTLNGRYGAGMLDRALFIAAVSALLLTIASFLGSVYWLFELLTHFRLQFVVGGTAIMLWALIRRRSATALLAAVTVAGCLPPLVPYFVSGTAAAHANQQQVRVMAANVHFRNTDYVRLRDAIRRDDPDIVGLVEVNETWVDELAAALSEYPYTVLWPEEGAYGLALFSRLPIKELRTSPYAQDGIRMAIAVELELESSRTTLVLAHLTAPTSRTKAALRDAQITSLVASLQRDSGDEKILIGDLNITPWSPKYAPLEAEAGLSNAARGRGYVPTWPNWLPGGFLRIPIDQVLTSDGLSVQRFRTGPDIGSDHLPIVADIALAESAPADSL